MTDKQKQIVYDLRLELMRLGYPRIHPVNSETLTAVTEDILEWKQRKGLREIVDAGPNGIWFKGCELVLKVDK